MAGNALAEQLVIRVADGVALRSIRQSHAVAERAGIGIDDAAAIGRGIRAAAGDTVAKRLHLRVGDITAVRRKLRLRGNAEARELQVPVRHGTRAEGLSGADPL